MKITINFVGSPFYNFCKTVADIVYISYMFCVIVLAIALLPVKYLLASIGWLIGVNVSGIKKGGIFGGSKYLKLFFPYYRFYFSKFSLAI